MVTSGRGSQTKPNHPCTQVRNTSFSLLSTTMQKKRRALASARSGRRGRVPKEIKGEDSKTAKNQQ